MPLIERLPMCCADDVCAQTCMVSPWYHLYLATSYSLHHTLNTRDSITAHQLLLHLQKDSSWNPSEGEGEGNRLPITGEDYRTRIGPLVASGKETRLVYQTQSMCGHLASVK